MPVFIVCPYCDRNIRISEDGQRLVRLWRDGCALNVLVVPKLDVDGRLSHSPEELCAWVLVEHAFAESPKLLPLEPSVL